MSGLDLNALIAESVTEAQVAGGVDPAVVLARQRRDGGNGCVVQAASGERGGESRLAPWSRGEEKLLERWLGYYSLDEIARRLGRSRAAVKIRFTRKGMNAPSKQKGEISARKVADRLGKCGKSIKKMIERGILPARRIPGESNIHVVSEAALLRWVTRPDNWIYFDVNRVQYEKYRRLATRAQKEWGDAWLTTGQVAQMHQVTHMLVNKYIHDGKLPAVRWQNWNVRLSDAKKVNFVTGSGVNSTVVWHEGADVFLVLAWGVGIPSSMIDHLTRYPNGRSWYRMKLLQEEGRVGALAPETAVWGEDDEVFVDWRRHRERFRGVARAARRFVAGKRLSWVERNYVRGVMMRWAGHHGLADLAHKLTYSSHAKTATLRRRYEQLVAAGVDPFTEEEGDGC